MMRGLLTPRILLKTGGIISIGSSHRQIASITPTRLGILKASSNAGVEMEQKSSFHKSLLSSNKQQNGRLTDMRAIRVDAFGDESVLKAVSQSIPVPKDDEVLIKVESIGVNPVEAMIRKGYFGNMIQPPYVPGTDVAGVVEQVGSSVKKFKKGDRVYSIKTNSGAYAEFCTAPADYVSPLSNKLSFSQGAAIGLPYTVAYKSLFIRAHSKKGETVFIHGASGAVGQAATQMAKAKGMKVIGTAGTPEGVELVKVQGADHVFNHREQGYMDKVKAATGGKGVDVVLEMMANKNLVADLGVVTSRGRIVVIGNNGPIQDFNPSLLMGVEADIMGMVVQVSTPEEYKEMLKVINQGQGDWVIPHIAKEYPLEKAPQAHKDLSGTNGSTGKIILKPRS